MNDRAHRTNRSGSISASGYEYSSSWLDVSGRTSLRAGDRVIATRPLRNDGTYPHEDVGVILVRRGDLGYVVEVVNSGGGEYYTVEFVDRAIVIATWQHDIARIRDN